jgi:hypothetical protein
MTRTVVMLALILLFPLGGAPIAGSIAPDAPVFAADGALKLQSNYREWVFLTSGLDMNYNSASPPMSGQSMFDNVFVNPSSYRAFLATGTWPDKTTFILEIRGASAHTSIDRHGQSQDTTIHAIEAHVKDSSLPGKWGFFEFGSSSVAKITERPASCYSCHQAHAAVDTTFVQFYPTLIDIARQKGTLSPEYLKDESFPNPASPAPRDR